MAHIPAKFQGNTANRMRFRVTMRKLTDGQTDRWTDRRGHFNIYHRGSSVRREIQIAKTVATLVFRYPK